MPDEPAESKESQEQTPPAEGQTPPQNDERLAALLSSPQSAEAFLGQLAHGNAQLEQRLAALEGVLTRLASPTPSAPPTASSAEKMPDYGALFGKPSVPAAQAPAHSPIDANAIAALVKDAVNDAVAPIRERVVAESEREQRKTRQGPSFAAAVRSFPQLLDRNSPEAQLFDQLYAGMPDVAKLDKAPQILAEMVRGLSVTQRQEERRVAAQKTQAAANVPRYATVEVPDDVGKAKKLTKELADKGSKRGLEDGEFEDLLRLQIGTSLAETQG